MEDENKMDKMSGYLEKKGKLKVMCSWKKYWFVLEGRLLLYYRSKDEYETLSPCKGTINLGPPCTVKSCPSVQGVFQIETRANTITLRADDRGDQNRWMQAIMSALNQNVKSNQAKLSHFRYSLDNLVPPPDVVETIARKTKFERYNTMPTSVNVKNSQKPQNKPIIERLQKMGAQSYGGSLSQINKIVNHPFKKQGSVKKKKTKQKTSESNNELNKLQKECEYADILDCNKKPDVCIRQNSEVELHQSKQFLGLTNYEEIHHQPTDHVESKNYNEIPNNEIDNEITLRKDFNEENIYERISGDSIKSTNTRIESFMIDNDNYSIPNKKSSILKRLSRENNNSVIIENDQYYTFGETKIGQENNENPEADHYNTVKEVQNTQTVENSEKSGEEQIYDEPKLNTTNENNKTDEVAVYSEATVPPEVLQILRKKKNAENVYEAIEDIYSELKLNVETSSQSSVENQKLNRKNKIKNFFTVKKHQTHKDLDVKNVEKCEKTKESNKVGKSSSFITKVFRRRMKNNGKNEQVYEEILGLNQTESNYEELDQVKVMPEKEKLQKTLSDQTMNITRKLHEELKERQKNHKKSKSAVDASQNTVNHSQDLADQFRSPSEEEPYTPQIPTKRSSKSLDEILSDLDKEKRTISRNNDSTGREEVIVLRHHPDIEITYRHSEDLDTLLNELLKVTTAPVLPPGATNSLINPTLNDEEWLKMLPIRKRRLSDPDYDIPRPHKSLQTIVTEDKGLIEPVITATRFFGPVLENQNKNNNDNCGSEESLIISMTPDSLEPSQYLSKQHKPSNISSEDKDISYTSHNYQLNNNKHTEETQVINTYKEVKCNTCKLKKDNLDDIIYAKPKAILSVATHDISECGGRCNENHGILNYRKKPETQLITYKNEKNIEVDGAQEVHGKVHEVFVDSLEHCAEVSTAF